MLRSDFFGRNLNKRELQIKVTRDRLPKSLMSSARDHLTPHILTRKTRLWLRNFVIKDAKRLLQHNRRRIQPIDATPFHSIWHVGTVCIWRGMHGRGFTPKLKAEP